MSSNPIFETGGGPETNRWTCVLTLDSRREPVSGSPEKLQAAIRRGADLRISTEFRHNEHIDTTSASAELISEVADFRITYVLEDRWVAGIINLRQPIELPNGFGPRPSMSFFLYNQNGQQAIARPYLDGAPITGKPGISPPDDHSAMPRFHEQDNWDMGTNAPSKNFIYDFDLYRFLVSDTWTEKLSHTADGMVLSGSVEELAAEVSRGREVKVAVSGLCADMTDNAISHEVFIHCGSCYYYNSQNLFMSASQPVVRVWPAIPLVYASQNWDFGWLMPRSDGLVARWLVDPYTLKFRKSEGRYAIRWFVR
jgi:hypothetical protein